MTGRQQSRVAWMFPALALAAVPRAVAQTPKVDFAAGYAWEDDHGFKYPAGWALSAEAHFTPWLGIVGETAGNYHRDHVPNLPGYTYAGQPYTVSQHSFATGPRAAGKISLSVTGFGQVLFGTHRIAGVPTEPFGWSQWSFLVQPGGGVSIRLSRLVDVRATVDFPLVRVETFDVQSESFDHEFHRMTRIGAGFGFSFGERH